MFAAFPRVGIWPLAWVAPIFWLVLVQRPRLLGRRPMRAIWLAGGLHWLIMLQGIRLAHPANYLGWVALSFYLAVYLPCFVALTRVAVHRMRTPLILAAPVVWTGLELARGYLITGFSMGLLGHALFEQTVLIQIADLFGAYGVSFWVMLVAACLTQIGKVGRSSKAIVPTAVLIVSVGIVLCYGLVRMSSMLSTVDGPTLKVALIQHSVDKKFVSDPQRNRRTFCLYRDLSLEARERNPDLDLIVWPESVFTENLPEYLCHGEFVPPADVPMSPVQARQQFQRLVSFFNDKVRTTADAINQIWHEGQIRRLDIYLLVGSTAIDIGNGNRKDYNAALLIDPKAAL